MTIDGVSIWLDEADIAGYRQNFTRLQSIHAQLHSCIVSLLLTKPMTSFPMCLQGLDAEAIDVLTAAQIVYVGDGSDRAGNALTNVPFVSPHVAAIAKQLYCLKPQ